MINKITIHVGDILILQAPGTGFHTVAERFSEHIKKHFPEAIIALLPQGMEYTHISFANVCDQGSPLAFGTKGCSAADVPKVPKAW